MRSFLALPFVIGACAVALACAAASVEVATPVWAKGEVIAHHRVTLGAVRLLTLYHVASRDRAAPLPFSLEARMLSDARAAVPVGLAPAIGSHLNIVAGQQVTPIAMEFPRIHGADAVAPHDVLAGGDGLQMTRVDTGAHGAAESGHVIQRHAGVERTNKVQVGSLMRGHRHSAVLRMPVAVFVEMAIPRPALIGTAATQFKPLKKGPLHLPFANENRLGHTLKYTHPLTPRYG